MESEGAIRKGSFLPVWNKVLPILHFYTNCNILFRLRLGHYINLFLIYLPVNISLTGEKGGSCMAHVWSIESLQSFHQPKTETKVMLAG